MADVATCSAAPLLLHHARPDGSLVPPASKRRASQKASSQLNRLPDAIIDTLLLDKFTARELCALARVNLRFKLLTNCESRWKELFQEKWNEITPLTERAKELAGGWQALYKAKILRDRESNPWRKPCSFELTAALEQLTAQASKNPERDLAVLFLLDGSGSVQEEDFTTMTTFISNAAQSIQQKSPQAKVGILQFSNDVRVEMSLQPLELEALSGVVSNMVRMNGGTNIATSIEKAAEIMKKEASEDSGRVLVLITDGRVDSYQAREAVATAERLSSEQANVSLFAFGVGRDVSKKELISIVSVTDPAMASCRYVELCVRDELPW